MNNTHSNKSLSLLLRDLKEWAGAVLGLIISIITIIQMIKGDAGTISIVLLCLGVSILWMSFLYIFLRKSDTPTILITDSIGSPIKRSYTYSQRLRRLTLIGIIGIPLLGVAILGIQLYFQARPSEKIIILVAEFEGPDPKNYRVTENITEQLRQATRRYKEVSVQGLSRVISAQEGSDLARELGESRKAAIVLWGWYGKTETSAEVNIHFELLRECPHLDLKTDSQTLKIAVGKLQGFEIQIQLSNEMSYLVLLTIGLARFEAGDLDGAIERFTDALNQMSLPAAMINPAAAYVYRGTAYYYKQAMDSAIADYDRSIDLNPNDPGVYTNRGNAYMKKGEYCQAIGDYSKAINLSPDDSDLYMNRAITHFLLGQHEASLADYEVALKLNPNESYIYNNRAVVFFMMSDFERSISDYDKAISLSPNDEQLYSNRGAIYALKKNYIQAIADFKKAIDLNPHAADAHYNCGKVYYEMGDTDIAITEFSKAINIEADYSAAYSQRGLAYEDKGEYGIAKSDFEEAIRLEPMDYVSIYNLGNWYLKKSQFDRALEYFNKALKLKPDSAEVLFACGFTYLQQKNTKEAITNFKKFLKVSKDKEACQSVDRLLRSL